MGKELQRSDRKTKGTILTEDSIIRDPEPALQEDVRDTSTYTHTHSELEAFFDELHEEEEGERARASTPQGSSWPRSIGVRMQMRRSLWTLIISRSGDHRGLGCTGTLTLKGRSQEGYVQPLDGLFKCQDSLSSCTGGG